MVIEKRLHDGANQMGDMPNAQGIAYGDYTGYLPLNSADEMKDLPDGSQNIFQTGKEENLLLVV